MSRRPAHRQCWPAIAGLCLVAAASPAHAECKQPRLEGYWEAAQDFDPYHDPSFSLAFYLWQQGETLSGWAEVHGKKGNDTNDGGTVSGRVQGNHVALTVAWSASGSGAYDGYIADDGTISGTTQGNGQTQYWITTHDWGVPGSPAFGPNIVGSTRCGGLSLGKAKPPGPPPPVTGVGVKPPVFRRPAH
jgi:hypothetical protein